MKKRLFILFVIFSVLTTVGLSINYLLSLHKISFNLDPEVNNITVYTADQTEVKQLSANGYLLLKEGEYYVIPEGEKLANDKIELTVEKDDLSIEIVPAYTKEYLETLLGQEKSAIQTALATKYPSLIGGFTLSQGRLYERGEWFGGLLKPKVADIRDQRAPYRVILHKEGDDTWAVIRRPEYILTSSRYKDVPIDILREINAVVGEPGN